MNSSPPSPALTPAHSKNTPYTPPTSTSPSPHTLIPLTNSPSSLVPDSNPPALQKSQSTAKISNSNFFDQLENARDLLVVAVSRIVGENWKNASPEYHAAKYPGDKIAPIKRGTTSEHPLQLKVEATTAKKAKVETPTPLLPMASSSTGITRTTTTNDSDNEEEASHESEAEHLKLPSTIAAAVTSTIIITVTSTVSDSSRRRRSGVGGMDQGQ
ncbi:hypothetical protein BGX23_005808 [Mortierella sp. AD031]|nr:hypothetical protein BGX23_005808 [Mortierella sp. AD031]